MFDLEDHSDHDCAGSPAGSRRVCLGVTIGAFLGDRFNGLSFKFGALVLFAAAVLAGYYWDGGRAFDGSGRNLQLCQFCESRELRMRR